MARTKRIWREWQHPRASDGRFARKGSPEWVRKAAEKFRSAEEGLKAGTSAPGMPGGQRRGISRGAKAERAFAAHDASVTTRLGRQPVQGPQPRPASSTRGKTPRAAKETFLQREAALKAMQPPPPKPALRNEENLMKFAGTAAAEAARRHAANLDPERVRREAADMAERAAARQARKERLMAERRTSTGLTEDELRNPWKHALAMPQREMRPAGRTREETQAERDARVARTEAAMAAAAGTKRPNVFDNPAFNASTGKGGVDTGRDTSKAGGVSTTTNLSPDAPVVAPADANPKISAQDHARIRHAVADHAHEFMGGPLKLGKDDAVRYTTEGYLKDLNSKYGTNTVWDEVAKVVEANPHVLKGSKTATARRVADRNETSANFASEALTAVKAGEFSKALARLNEGEDANPDYRDTRGRSFQDMRDVVMARMTTAADAKKAEASKPKEPSAADLAIGKELFKLHPTQRTFDPAASNGARDAGRAAAEAEVDSALPSSNFSRSTLRARMGSAAGAVAAFQQQREVKRAEIAKVRDLLGKIEDPTYREEYRVGVLKPLEHDEEVLMGAIGRQERELDKAREDLKRIVDQGGAKLAGQRADEAFYATLGAVHAGGKGYGEGRGAKVLAKYGLNPSSADVKAMSKDDREAAQSEIMLRGGHRDYMFKAVTSALRGVDTKNLTPEQRQRWADSTGKPTLTAVATLAARQRRDQALSRIAALEARKPQASDSPELRTKLADALTEERGNLADAQAELADLEPQFPGAIDAINAGITELRASAGLKPGKMNAKTLDTGYRKLLESRGITPQENPPAPVKKGAIERISDTIAAQRGLERAPASLRAESAATETPTMDVVKATPVQRTAYHDMSRANLVALSNAAGLPTRGRTNDRLAEALARNDAEKKAARNLNPSGVGTPSSQHVELPQHDGGMARQAALNEGVAKLRDKIAEQRAAKAASAAPERAILSDQELRSMSGRVAPGSVAAMDIKNELEARRLGIPPSALPNRDQPKGQDWTADVADRVRALDERDRQRAAERDVQASRDAATLRGLARQREKSMSELYAQHADLTREQFDAMPADQREAVLADLRKVRDSKDQVSSTIASNRSGFYGATLRGTKDAPHVKGAQDKLYELTKAKVNPDDYTVAGRARRAAAGDVGAIDGTMEDLQAIASANKWGYVGSWKKDKARDYLRNHAIAYDILPERWDNASVAESMRGADSRKALALLDIQDADGRLTLADLNTIAASLGLPKPKGKDKRARMHDLAGQAKGAAPKAEAAREAAPEAPKAPLVWVNKANGHVVTNPSQVGIVRGDIVKADSEAGKAATAALEARRSANLAKAQAAATEKRVSELEASKDPKDNAGKIKAITDGRMTHADLYRTAMAGPSGQRAPVLAGRVRHTPDNPSGEFRVVDRNGQLAGWVTPVVRNGEQKYSVTSENYDGGTELLGWADSLAHAADVLTHGEAAASTGGTLDARRISGRLFERNPTRGKTLDELNREALDREIRQHREALNNPNLGPQQRASRERALANLEAERRGEAPPEAPKAEADPKAARIAAKEAELKAAQDRFQREADWRPHGGMRRKAFGVRVDANLRRAGEAKRDIDRLERELAALKRPTPPPSAAHELDVEGLEPGDLVKMKNGLVYKVAKVNKSTVKVVVPPGMDDLVQKSKIVRTQKASVTAPKAEAPKAPATTRGRFDRTLKTAQLDTRRDNSQNGGGSNISATTEASMAAKAKSTDEPQLGVTESNRGRTTTVTLPDGTTAQRTSKTMTYTHAVVTITDQRANARDLRATADTHDTFAAALQKWVDEGADFSKLEKHRTDSLSELDRREGRSPYEYFLPGFGPVERQRKKTRFGGGGTYLADEGQYGIPDPADKKELRYAPGETGYSKYGPEYMLKHHRGRAASARANADKLDAGPAETYGVYRWSQSVQGAMAGANEFGRIRNTRTQIVGVGGVAKVATPEEKAAAAEAKKVTAAEERAAAREVAKATDAERRAASNAKFFADTRAAIEQDIREGKDPEGELQYKTEAALRSLAKEYGVKLPRLPRDSYGRSQPLDRDNARKLIVAKIRADLLERQGKA